MHFFFFQIALGLLRKVCRGSGTIPSPLPRPPETQHIIKKTIFVFESGTSNHYYQVKASSIFVFPRPKNCQNGHQMVKILVRVTLALILVIILTIILNIYIPSVEPVIIYCIKYRVVNSDIVQRRATRSLTTFLS